MILVIGAVSAEAASIAPEVEAAAAIGNRTAVNPPGVDLSLVSQNAGRPKWHLAIKITTGAVSAGAAPEVEAAVAIGRRTIVNPSRLDPSLVGHNATSPIWHLATKPSYAWRTCHMYTSTIARGDIQEK
jgi:hypothetical protein